MPDPEQLAREKIDALLAPCGWAVQDKRAVNLAASRGVAVRELSFKGGEPDYTLFVDGKAIGTIEAKPAGHSLTGVEEQSEKYVKGVPFGIPAWRSPLPFSYESTGTESRFTNRLDPVPRSRNVFAFHCPEALLGWVEKYTAPQAVETITEYANRNGNFLSRIQHMPPLIDDLWPPKPQAIMNIEQSLRDNRPRSLVQMATGSGKTLLAIVMSYRLIKFAGAKRVLFLVDRGNLGKQTLKEFQQYVSPYNNYKFHEEYVLQRLTSNTLDTTAKVCIGTIQRLYSMLKGQELDEEADERSVQGLESLFKEAPPIEYNPAFPIDTFDIIITDECHRSIYNLWRQVLEYFDAHLIGLTATPSKQTFGFFNQNLVMEYNHERAVADGVNVNYDVYRIQTEITAQGAKIDAGFYVDKRDRQTRKKRWEQLDDDFQYDANQLDRDVVAEDQIRTVMQTFRDKLFTEIFPGRDQVPKTLIFAKDDSHADDIVRICREVFDKGNDFCQKITYRTGFMRDVEKKIGADGKEIEEVVWKKVSNLSPDQILQAFRNSYNPRIAVTVDMIATGTDVKPLEIVFFMRSVRSRGYFEQMKGRGVRVISETEMEQVNPGIKRKNRCEVAKADIILRPSHADERIALDVHLDLARHSDAQIGLDPEDLLRRHARRPLAREHEPGLELECAAGHQPRALGDLRAIGLDLLAGRGAREPGGEQQGQAEDGPSRAHQVLGAAARKRSAGGVDRACSNGARWQTSSVVTAMTCVAATISLTSTRASSSSAPPRMTPGPYRRHGMPAVQWWQVNGLRALGPPSLRPRSQAITSPALHTAAPLEPPAQPSVMCSSRLAPARATAASPSRGTSSWRSRDAPRPAGSCPRAGRAFRGRGGSARLRGASRAPRPARALPRGARARQPCPVARGSRPPSAGAEPGSRVRSVPPPVPAGFRRRPPSGARRRGTRSRSRIRSHSSGP